jgi:putative isomerase
MEEKNGTKERLNFPDVLNVKNTPESTVDWESFCFSDLGAWYGIALADSGYKNPAFTGPFVMANGKWWAQTLLELDFKIDRKAQDLFGNYERHSHYFPGKLCHTFSNKDITLSLELIFSDSTHSLIRKTIENNTGNNISIEENWHGKAFTETARFIKKGNSVFLKDNEKQDFFSIHWGNKPEHIELNNAGEHYTVKLQALYLKAQSSHTQYFSIGHGTTGKIKNPEKVFAENKVRWNQYINKVTYTPNQWGNQKQYQRIAVKALITLINNWRSARGHLHIEGLFPSYAVNYFNGFWAWDSWKHAVALAVFEPALAKNQIRTMFTYQNTAGMIPDCIYLDSNENNWLNTKPPLAAWSVWEVYKATADTNFVEEMLPALTQYHNWWYKYRDYNKNLLCEYGSSDQSLIAAKWESGMDNAIRFDSSNMVQLDKNNWAFNQESVDLNAYLYMEKKILAKMHETLGNLQEKNTYEYEAEKLKFIINSQMFDKEEGYYFDKNTETNALVRVLGPEGWTPLFTKLAEGAQAASVAKQMMDTSTFSSYIPFPTAAVDEPEFSTGYWRGPIWLDQVYFAIAALNNYGYSKEAQQYTLQVFDRLQGLKEDAPIRENYWPLNGEGMRVNHFSWSAAHLLMLYQMDFSGNK